MASYRRRRGAAGRGRRRPVRRRVPGRRRLGHAAQGVRRPGAGDHRHRHPRPGVRHPRGRRAPPAGWTSGRRSATCSAPGWSCGSATRPTRWSTGGPRSTCRRSAGRGSSSIRPTRTEPALADRAARAAAAAATPADAGQGDRRRAGPGRPRRGCGCCRRRCRTPTSTWTAATGLRLPIGIAEADLRPVDDRLRQPSRTSCSSATPSAASRRSCGRWPPRSPRRFTPEQARIILVDYRRSLLGRCPSRAPDRVRHQAAADRSS